MLLSENFGGFRYSRLCGALYCTYAMTYEIGL